jgi:hypothetical protein
MKLIYLNTFETVKVDDADYAWLSRWRWQAKQSAYSIYACRSYYRQGKRGTIRMHREIMNCPEGKEVDHIDGDTFNNQRSNLQIVDKSVNIFYEQRPLFRPGQIPKLTSRPPSL